MRPKKHLGQHFLTSKPAVAKMIKAAEIIPNDLVVEIGPGKGFLTEDLLKSGCTVYAFEKDNESIEYLKENLSSTKLKIFDGDFLEYELEKVLPKTEYKIVANIPYYITGMIMEKVLTSKLKPSVAVMLVQKEVAERIVARDKKESLLSIAVKVFCEPKIIDTVKAGSFFPKPKVDSAIIALNKISGEFFKEMDEKRFFEILKTGFAHKRKKLIGNLSQLFDKEKLVEIFKKINLDENIRPENLTPNDWRKLVLSLN